MFVELTLITLLGITNHVYDGDTIYANIVAPGCPTVFCYNIGVRIKGLDTPEINGECEHEKALAERAKDLVKKIVPEGTLIVLTDVGRDKYFRINANVSTLEGINIAQELLKEGLAVPYDGQKKTHNWCSTE